MFPLFPLKQVQYVGVISSTILFLLRQRCPSLAIYSPVILFLMPRLISIGFYASRNFITQYCAKRRREFCQPAFMEGLLRVGSNLA